MRSISLASERQSKAALELYRALRSRTPIVPLTARPGLGFDIDDAYAISLGFLHHRLADGERVVGKKIGVTSRAVMDMLGVDQPDFGFLTDAMQVDDGATVDIAQAGLIQPRAEAEIAFILRHDLDGTCVTDEQVLDATESVTACFEIVDSRIRDWQIGIVDTIADNASCGVFVLGGQRVDPRGLDLPSVEVTMRCNGTIISQGVGAAVQGSPLTAVAWLANKLGCYGVKLARGDVILSGSLVPLAPARRGDLFELETSCLGSCSVGFA